MKIAHKFDHVTYRNKLKGACFDKLLIEYLKQANKLK